MKNKVCRVIAYVLGILPLVVLVMMYSKLPNQVPVHWNLDGTVRYGQKTALWVTYATGLIMTLMGDIIPRIDPRKENYKKFGKYYDIFILTIVVFLDIICGITLVEAMMPGTISVGKVCCLLVGCIFVITGNLLPKVKSNFYMGIKTPWALSNTDIWNRTQRLGGRIMFVWGIAIIIGSLVLQPTLIMGLVISGAVLLSIIPALMSYIWYQKVER